MVAMDATPSLHILVVEDNDSLRDATTDFLNANGHHTTGVSSAEEVDDTPTRDLPDLYLVDVNLPGEDGFSLIKRIRASQPLAGIVLMTARGQLHDRLDGYNHGADNYLIKPVEQAELLACVRGLALRLKAGVPKVDGRLMLYSNSHRLIGPLGESQLSHGESMLLAAFSRAAGRKLERWQAMQLVDHHHRGLSQANMEMRISSLRKKLHTCGAPDASILALRGFGYALNCEIEIR
ncbi:response regulator transcription factor [Hydrogenophaga atypica]|uniref:Response regulator transcription factor n=1 Tax=Hydrogenophaga atypica TaxID=249409 RepID=A0ABW2QME3_9BURK